MATALWDKGLIKVYINPMTGQIENAIDSPDWTPSPSSIGMTYNSERDLKAHYPGVDFKILGVKLEHNNTKTTESAFGFKVTEEEMIEGGKMIPTIEPNTDKLMMLFTKAAVEAKHAEGVRDKSYKKGFCNGVGKAIMAINPSLKERLQDIVNNAKDQDLDDSDSFI